MPETNLGEGLAPMPETYLGDGLYAEFDGEFITLRAPRPGGNEMVYLDASVLRNFERWLAELRKTYPDTAIARYQPGT